MSTDTFEDELRSLLRHTADAEAPAYLDVDTETVLTSGRRVVRRRRAAAGLGVVASTLAFGLLGFSALGDGVDGAEPVPGSPTSTSATGTVTVDLQRTAEVAPEGGTPAGRPTLRVKADRTSGRLEYLVDRDGTFVRVGQGALPTAPRGATWLPTQALDGLVVGVLPAAATDLALVWAGDAPGATHTTAPIPGTGYQAFAIWHTGTTPNTSFAGLDWTDGTAVYDSAGAELASGKFGDLVAFVDDEQNVFGLFGDGTSTTKRLSDTAAGSMPVIMQGVRPDGATTMAASVLVVLPAGAEDVIVTPQPGATVVSTEVTGGGTTGRTLVLARLDVPDSVAGTGVQRVAWTEADGAKAATEVGF